MLSNITQGPAAARQLHGPVEGVRGVEVGEEVDTLHGLQLTVLAQPRPLPQHQARLEGVQLVLGVQVGGEGGRGGQQLAPHQVEPRAGGEQLQPGARRHPRALHHHVLPHRTEAVEEKVVEVLAVVGAEPRPHDGGHQVAHAAHQGLGGADLARPGAPLPRRGPGVLLDQLETAILRMDWRIVDMEVPNKTYT